MLETEAIFKGNYPLALEGAKEYFINGQSMLHIWESKRIKRGFAFKVWVYFFCVSFLLLANRFHTVIAEAEEMSRPLDEMVSLKERVDKLIEELDMIKNQSFGMACSIHKEPALKTQSAEKAYLLRERLLEIAKALKRIDPAKHRTWFYRISEPHLDLSFVLADSGMTSLRLGDIIKWGTRPGH